MDMSNGWGRFAIEALVIVAMTVFVVHHDADIALFVALIGPMVGAGISNRGVKTGSNLSIRPPPMALLCIIVLMCLSCGAALPSAQDEKTLSVDEAAKTDCVLRSTTRKQADECTAAVDARRPIQVYIDGGKE